MHLEQKLAVIFEEFGWRGADVRHGYVAAPLNTEKVVVRTTTSRYTLQGHVRIENLRYALLECFKPMHAYINRG